MRMMMMMRMRMRMRTTTTTMMILYSCLTGTASLKPQIQRFLSKTFPHSSKRCVLYIYIYIYIYNDTSMIAHGQLSHKMFGLVVQSIKNLKVAK